MIHFLLVQIKSFTISFHHWLEWEIFFPFGQQIPRCTALCWRPKIASNIWSSIIVIKKSGSWVLRRAVSQMGWNGSPILGKRKLMAASLGLGNEFPPHAQEANTLETRWEKYVVSFWGKSLRVMKKNKVFQNSIEDYRFPPFTNQETPKLLLVSPLTTQVPLHFLFPENPPTRINMATKMPFRILLIFLLCHYSICLILQLSITSPDMCHHIMPKITCLLLQRGHSYGC